MVYLAGTVGIFHPSLGSGYIEETRWAVGAMASSALGYFLAYVLLFNSPLCRQLQSMRRHDSGVTGGSKSAGEVACLVMAQLMSLTSSNPPPGPLTGLVKGSSGLRSSGCWLWGL